MSNKVAITLMIQLNINVGMINTSRSNIINEIGNPTLNKSEIEQKLQQLTDAQNALQGSHLLEEAKNNAITGNQ